MEMENKVYLEDVLEDKTAGLARNLDVKVESKRGIQGST